MGLITPLLDTLLHEVLGRRMDSPSPRRIPEAVRAVPPDEGLFAVKSDSRLNDRQTPLPGPDSARTQRGDARITAGAEPAVPFAPGQAPAAGRQSGTASLSPTARAIASILERYRQPPSVLRTSHALMAADDQPEAGLLANRLENSIRHSGLFYESHLQRWYRGSMPLGQLAREPQASLWAPATSESQSDSANEQLLYKGAQTPQGDRVLPLDESLQSVVRQQLELLANPVLRWEGDVWAGIFMALVVQAPGSEHDRRQNTRKAEDDPGEQAWRSHLHLEIEGLGKLGIDIMVRDNWLALAIHCPSIQAEGRLKAGEDALRSRLLACGFEAIELQIQWQENE